MMIKFFRRQSKIHFTYKKITFNKTTLGGSGYKRTLELSIIWLFLLSQMPTSRHQDSPHHSLWRGMIERGVEERPRPPESPDSRHRDDENKETLSGNRKYIGLLSTTAVCSTEIEIEFNFIYLLSNNSYCVK